MTNNLKKLLYLIITLMSITLTTNITINAENNSNLEKVYCSATLDDDFSANEVLIVLNKETSKQLNTNISFDNIDYLQIEDLTSSYDSEEEMNDNFRRIYKMTLNNSNKKKVLNTIKELEEINYVYSAEPNYYDQISSVPNDYSSTRQYAVGLMDLDEAWNFTIGSNEITVGIIDTGIDGDHPDLQANINTQLSRNFSSDFTDALDDIEGHGTHVAGIVGAVGNNNIGMTGVNWNISLVSLRVANSAGGLPIANVISAINYANEDDVNIDILNYSGGYNHNNLVASREQAIENYDGLFVCSAGNNTKNTDVELHYPSSHNCSNLISVGSIDDDNERSYFSNYGLNSVDIYAPGGSIYSTINGNSYAYYSGTSMASPQVAGVAALLLSIKPDLTALELKYAMINSAETISIIIPGGTTQSVKKLNAFNAVKYVLNQYSDTANLKYGNKVLSKSIDSSSSYFVQKNYMLKLVVQNSYIYDFAISASNSLNMTLYDSNFNVLSTITGGTQINFSRELSVGTYYLKTSYNDSSVQGSINITIYGEEHTHSCSDWAYYNRSLHRSICSCGQQITRPHVVSASATGRFKPCLECGYLLDMNYDIGIVGPFSLNLMVTSNGSYILPSGIIVLVDEDIEAYFNDTLVFYQSGTIIS